MKNQNLESARVHLRTVHNAANKSPLHLACVALFAHSCEVAGVSADLNPAPAESPAEDAPASNAAAPAADESNRAAGLAPAPRGVVKRTVRKAVVKK